MIYDCFVYINGVYFVRDGEKVFLFVIWDGKIWFFLVIYRDFGILKEIDFFF